MLFLVVSIVVTGLLWLFSEVLEGDTFAIDKAILTGLRTAANPSVPIGPSWLLPAVRDITALGGVTVLPIVTLMVVGFLIAIRKRSMAVFVTCAVASGALVNTGLKSIPDYPLDACRLGVYTMGHEDEKPLCQPRVLGSRVLPALPR